MKKYEVARLIHKHLGENMKFILCVRDPVDRLHSDYFMVSFNLNYEFNFNLFIYKSLFPMQHKKFKVKTNSLIFYHDV